MNLLIYTSVMGKPDTLFDARLDLPYDQKCFTDMGFRGGNKYDMVRASPPGSHPGRQQRHVKLYWPDVLDKYEYSLYLDSNVQLLVDPVKFVEMLGDNDLLVFKHEFRDCVYEEAEVLLEKGIGDPERIKAQMEKYRAEGYPERNGMGRCTVIFRRHTKAVKEFSRKWWNEVNEFCYRDQLSFPYLLWKTGYQVSTFPELWPGNPWFKGYEHGPDDRFVKEGQKMECLDLGCGKHKHPGCIGVDKSYIPGVEYIYDLEKTPWPFRDGRFDKLFASHLLEHINNLIPFMNEAHRILKRGGKFEIYVPLAVDDEGRVHRGAFQDPTHVRFFVEETFSYFTGRSETASYGILPWIMEYYEERDRGGSREAVVILRKPDIDEMYWAQ